MQLQVNKFFSYLEGLSTPASTLSGYKSHLKNFVNWLSNQGITDPKYFNRDLIRAYQNYLHFFNGHNGMPTDPKYQNSIQVTVKKFLDFLYEEEEIDIPLSHFLKAVKVPQVLPKRVMKHDDVVLLLEQPRLDKKIGYRDRTVLELMYGCGLRVGETCGLKLQSINLEEETVLVFGKGSKERLLPIPQSALRFLETYIRAMRSSFKGYDRYDSLFLNIIGTPLQTKAVDTFFKKYLKKAGITEHYTTHSLRKACTTELVKANANVYMVQKFLGHTSLSSIEYYAKLDVEDLRKVVEQYHPRG